MLSFTRQAALKTDLAIVAAIMFTALAPATPAWADSRQRLYDFEEGTPGASATEAVDKLGAPPHLQEAFGAFYVFDSVVPGTNDAVPNGEPLKTWIDANVDPTPSLSVPFVGVEPTFIDVSDGTALDSPSLGSTVAMDFNGAQVLQGVGFRDSYVDQTAYDTNAAAAGGTNILSTFFNFSEAWVYADSASNGVTQTVWAIGEENGGVRITSDGFWSLAAVGGATGPAPTRPVAFDTWTHVGVARGGGSATLYVNGSVAATANGFFGKWGDFVTIGGDEDFIETFDGKIDSFGVGGNHDGGFSAFEDLSFFTDLGFDEPTGVLGDVDQDGDADQDDYLIWSENVGFDNGFGAGDVTTLFIGDLDANGKVDFFDFALIARGVEAMGGSLVIGDATVPEPSGLLIVALTAAGMLVGRRR